MQIKNLLFPFKLTCSSSIDTTSKKLFWYLILCEFYVGLAVFSDFTMKAISADGDGSPDRRPIVSPSNIEGNTWALSPASPPIASHPTLIDLQRGTEHAVERSVAKTSSDGFDDDPRRRTHHELPLPLLPPSTDTLTFPASPINSTATQPRRHNLDALERKIRRSLEEDFQHLTHNGDASSRPTLCATSLQVSSLPPLPPDALEELERKIRRSLLEDFTHLDKAPTDPTTPVSDPVLNPDPPATALQPASSLFPTPPCHKHKMSLPPVEPPHLHPMPLPASNQQPNNMPHPLPFSEITAPFKRRKKPPDRIDRIPKRLRMLLQTQIPQPSLQCPSSVHDSPYEPPQQPQKSLRYAKQTFKPP